MSDNAGQRARSALGVLLVSIAAGLGSGCAMFAGKARVTTTRWSGPREVERGVPVSLQMRARAFADGASDAGGGAREDAIFSTLLARGLRRAGVMTQPVATPAPGALNLAVDIEETRSGPVALRVASMATFRVIPSWESTTFSVAVDGEYRGRAIAPFRYEVDATEVSHLLLLPVAPFAPPDGVRIRVRRKAVAALVDHLSQVVAAAAPPPAPAPAPAEKKPAEKKPGEEKLDAARPAGGPGKDER